jgi:hemoglobin-like flavoprotein
MDIKESLHRIMTQAETLADLFYLVFLKDYPEVQRFFLGVDMKHQNVLLTMALLAMERHHEHRYPTTAAYLKMLGEQHRRLGIGKELYPKWRSALIDALERFHAEDWHEGLALQWRAAIDAATDDMLTAYA